MLPSTELRRLIWLLAALSLQAQSPRTYSAGLEWWTAGQRAIFPLEEDFDNPNGAVRVEHRAGTLQPEGHAFFEALGPNGRACITCHQPSDAMSVSVRSLQKRWAVTGSTEPVFAAVDGSNCPDLPQDQSTSHSLLLDRGLFRIAIAWPPNPRISPEFDLEIARDPYGCNIPGAGFLSVYRRPRMVANFALDPAQLMSDAREPSLRAQAITAALVHEQAATPPTETQLKQILDFEHQVFAKQRTHILAGLLYGTGNQPTFNHPQNETVAAFHASANQGAELFQKDCATCHQSGVTSAMDIGTNKQRDPDLPLFRITCRATGHITESTDPGLALTTGKCADIGSVVVQQLQGLSARAPYFSNGSAATLADVVNFYDRRSSLHYTAAQKQALVDYLTIL